jgi:hypothetical protein
MRKKVLVLIAAANVMKELLGANIGLGVVTPAPSAALLILMCVT